MLPLFLKGEKPLDFLGGPGIATGRVNQESQMLRIDRLEQEKIKGQFSYKRMAYGFPSFRPVEYIVTGP
ncbi:hypothetical protein KSC_071970 [Ktedonobacter sp. SOSP1-52]|nr:hypothetical protein KSC_071970 [Ktedonobacter sp. SOSP1-52]